LSCVQLNASYPGIERISTETYCGRTSDNKLRYRVSGRDEQFRTLREAVRASRLSP
jgi:hypothetical protein